MSAEPPERTPDENDLDSCDRVERDLPVGGADSRPSHGPQGVQARLRGDADWASESAKEILRTLIAQSTTN